MIVLHLHFSRLDYFFNFLNLATALVVTQPNMEILVRTKQILIREAGTKVICQNSVHLFKALLYKNMRHRNS